MHRDEETETAEIARQPEPGEDRMAFLQRVTDFANAKKVAIHFCLSRDRPGLIASYYPKGSNRPPDPDACGETQEPTP